MTMRFRRPRVFTATLPSIFPDPGSRRSPCGAFPTARSLFGLWLPKFIVAERELSGMHGI